MGDGLRCSTGHKGSKLTVAGRKTERHRHSSAGEKAQARLGPHLERRVVQKNQVVLVLPGVLKVRAASTPPPPFHLFPTRLLQLNCTESRKAENSA